MNTTITSRRNVRNGNGRTTKKTLFVRVSKATLGDKVRDFRSWNVRGSISDFLSMSTGEQMTMLSRSLSKRQGKDSEGDFASRTAAVLDMVVGGLGMAAA